MKNTTRAISAILCLVIVLSCFSASIFAASADDFTDVSKGDWFYEDVNYVVEKGLFNGTSATEFSPYDKMDRAMMVTALYRLAGNPEATEEAGFTDVKSKDYFAKAVDWGKESGVVNGASETTFDPHGLITREQVVVMAYRYYTEYLGTAAVDAADISVFADSASVSKYAKEAMAWAVGNEIITGSKKDGEKVLNPGATATRCEVVAILARLVKMTEVRSDLRIVCLAPSMVENVYALGYGDYIVGWSAYTDYPVAAQQTAGYEPYQFYYDTDTQDFDVDFELGKKPNADGVYKEVATVSKYYDYNEAILEGLNPTLILCEGSEQLGWVETLNAKGYPTYGWACESVDEIYDMMVEIGELLGCKERAEALVASYYDRIDEIKSVTKDLTKIRTYFEIAHQSDYGEWGKYGPYTEGGNTPFDEMIQIAGGENIFHDGEGYMNLYDLYGEDCFAETVKRDPQVILSPYWPGAYDFEVTSLYEIMTRPGFCDTQAVQTGRVAYYDSSLMKRFGPRTITAIEKLAYLLHPYYFENPVNSVSPWELGKIDVAEPFPAPLN